jgi:hypothetical protein
LHRLGELWTLVNSFLLTRWLFTQVGSRGAESKVLPSGEVHFGEELAETLEEDQFALIGGSLKLAVVRTIPLIESR